MPHDLTPDRFPARAVGLALVVALGCISCSGDAESPGPGSPAADAGDADGTSDAAQPDSTSNPGLPFGSCCGKHFDCASKRCMSVADGPYYCTQLCQPYPDDCPVGFYCDKSVTECIPASTSSYTCSP